MLSLRTINAMTSAEFIETFGGIYERSPWVAARSHTQLPFATPADLLSTFRDSVDQASITEQDTLIRAHPDLAGKLARSNALTTESTREQSRLGLNQLANDSNSASNNPFNRNITCARSFGGVAAQSGNAFNAP
jgi:OHCU decarboxylase